jgi:hypothetical protein
MGTEPLSKVEAVFVAEVALYGCCRSVRLPLPIEACFLWCGYSICYLLLLVLLTAETL